MPARDPDADPSELSEQLGLDHEHPLSVTQLTMCIKGLVEQSLPQVWLEGEVSDLSRPSSGHLYLTLKDQQCQIRAVMWRSAAQRLPFRLEDGQAIICSGAVEVYPPRGTYQLVISRVQPKGVGSLQLAFEQLHKRLASEGLFDVDRKRQLPAFPTRLAFVTSPSGAAIHDFIEAARQRWPALELMIIPAKVQGAGAVEDIVRGIQVAARLRPRPEILIVGRGGGSLEDLWCFNDERVVRALAASPIPTVSAVGHEVDVTLSDLVADVRALTPTQAAQVCLPSRSEVASFLEQARTRMLASCKNRILHARQRLTQLSHSRMLASPYEVINVRRQQIDEWEVRARQAMWQGWHRQRERVQGVARAAHALSPLQVLSRGFSLTADATNGKLLRSADELVIGQTVHTVLEHGSFTSNIVAIDRAATMATPSNDSPGNRVASSAAAIRPIDPSRSRKRSSS